MVREMGQSLIFIVSGALQLNLAQIFFQALILVKFTLENCERHM